jgi:hypothetical protein
MAGQRQLQAAAQAGAVDSGNHRNRQAMDLGHNLLPWRASASASCAVRSGQSC